MVQSVWHSSQCCKPLMDLKISPLHDSVLPFYSASWWQAASHCFKGNNGRVSHESSDSQSHISRLGYCFVSRHVISQLQSCTDSSLCTVVHALQRAKSLGSGQLVLVLNPSSFQSPVSSIDSNSSGCSTEQTAPSTWITTAVTLLSRFLIKVQA